jgi:acylphosphatase
VSPIARRFLVGGRVQGVGFRWFVKETAMREGVTGWVRNLHDGRVEALVEGESGAVDRVEQALREGPRSAHVERVGVQAEEPGGAFTTFSII